MTVYAPAHQPWHDDLPNECRCDPAWKDRGMVDDRCPWHRMLFAAEDLRDVGWTVEPREQGAVFEEIAGTLPEGSHIDIQQALCEHEWVSARNDFILSGEVCVKCYRIRQE